MSTKLPKYPVGQLVRVSPEITGNLTETGKVTCFTEVTDGQEIRFEYEIATAEKTYQNCREEQVYPNFVISSIL